MDVLEYGNAVREPDLLPHLHIYWTMHMRIALTLSAYALLGAGVPPWSATKPITDESLRVDALRGVFPEASISLEPGRSIDDSWSGGPPGRSKELSFPDALAGAKVYRVVGPPSGDAEECAASKDGGASFSKTREVRFEVFHWPGAPDSSALLVVLQYRFLGADPAMACPSIARVARVTNTTGAWRESAGFVLATTHHSAIQRIALTSLDGHHPEELLIESDWGGATPVGGMQESDLAVFSLRRGRFDQWLNVPALVSGGWASFVQTLDLRRTMEDHGGRFCFRKVMLAKNGQWLPHPVETHPCYARFTGPSAKGM